MEARLPPVTSRDCIDEKRSRIWRTPSQDTSMKARSKTTPPAKTCLPPARRRAKSRARTPSSAAKLTIPPREAARNRATMGRRAKTATANRRSRLTLPRTKGTRAIGMTNSANAVKCEVLKDAKNSDEKPEEHNEPDETTPIVRGAKQLRGKKQKKGVGEQELKIDPRIVRRGSATKN